MTLIEQLEQAEGPSRELDAEIAAAVRYFPKNVGFVWKNDLEANCPEIGRVTCVTSLGTGGPHYESPRYTASIDAALTLVPGSNEHTALFWQLGDDGAGGNPADFLARLLICTNLTSHQFRAVAATPALALCIVAIRAREADRVR